MMQKFSWRTMIIFVMVLLLGVILLGLGTAYVSKLKQERRRLSKSFGYRAFMEATFVLT
jgi:CHASE1-domain containing sensor protein